MSIRTIDINAPCTVCMIEIKLKIPKVPFMGHIMQSYSCDACETKFLSKFKRKKGGKVTDIESDTQVIKKGKEQVIETKNPYDRMPG